MLSYLAAALPSEVGAAARLLALQCALRATVSGRLWMPAGLLRGLRMNRHSSLWQEPEQSGWLTRLATNPPWAKQRGFAVQLLDAAVLTQAPGRRDRAHAADAALRLTSCPALRSLSASEQLAGLALATYLSPGHVHGIIEADRLGRVCAAFTPRRPDCHPRPAGCRPGSGRVVVRPGIRRHHVGSRARVGQAVPEHDRRE